MVEQRSEEKEVERQALQLFTAYMVRNYPGPNTIISDPTWHAPKIFRAAMQAMKEARREEPGNA